MTQETALPPSLQVEWRDEIAILRLARPEKRNALNDPTVLGIGTFFSRLPARPARIFQPGSISRSSPNATPWKG